jgi:hypothetical protein
MRNLRYLVNPDRAVLHLGGPEPRKGWLRASWPTYHRPWSIPFGLPWILERGSTECHGGVEVLLAVIGGHSEFTSLFAFVH